MMWQSWNKQTGDYLTKKNLFRRGYAESLPGLRPGLDAIVGDFSTSLFMHFDGPRRMREFGTPDTKLIVAVRNPVLRAFAHWSHNRAIGLENRSSFMDAFRDEATILSNPHCLNGETAMMAHDVTCYPSMRHSRSHFTVRDLPKDLYVSYGLYHHQLHNWLREDYSLDDFLFVDSSELESDPESIRNILASVASHIGLDPFPDSSGLADSRLPLRRNTALKADASRTQLTSRILRIMAQFFEPHNRAFYKLVGRDFGWEKEVADAANALDSGNKYGSANRAGGSYASSERAASSSNPTARRAGRTAPAYGGAARPSSGRT